MVGWSTNCFPSLVKPTVDHVVDDAGIAIEIQLFLVPEGCQNALQEIFRVAIRFVEAHVRPAAGSNGTTRILQSNPKRRKLHGLSPNWVAAIVVVFLNRGLLFNFSGKIEARCGTFLL